MPYPSQKTTFTDPAGTSFVAGTPAGGANAVDHAVLHTNINDTVEAIEDTLGTTAGTNLAMHMAAGQFPVRHTGVAATGTLVQTLVGGTFANITLIGTSQITGGTFTNAALIGTPQITGGTVGTTITVGGSVNNANLGTPTITVGSDATGDLLTRSAGGTLNRIASGTIGAFLRSAGTGVVPTWATGNIILVVSNTFSTVGSVAGTVHTDSGLAGTIVPIGTASKFLIMCNIETLLTEGTMGMGIFLVRDTTTINTPAINHAQLDVAVINKRDLLTFSYVDSPATLAATTYKVQYNRNTGGGTVYVQADGSTSSITILEIAQ